MHENEQIDQNRATDYEIQRNGGKKPAIKYKNLPDVKSNLESIQRFARYKMSSLISIGRLCTCI